MSTAKKGFTAIIDAHGQVWTNINKLRVRFDTSVDTKVFQEFIIDNMGFAQISVSNRHIEITLRPALVSGPTLGALLFMLEDAPALPCMANIREYDSNERHIILPAGSHRVAKLGQIVRAAKAPELAVVRRFELASGQFQAVTPFIDAIRDWELRCGSYNDLQISQLVVKYLRASFIRLHNNQIAQTFVLKEVGRGLPKFAHETFHPLVGHSFDTQPDQAHAKACSEAYTNAIKHWSPTLEEVEASAYWPGHGRLRRRYVRLILPLRLPNAGIEVLSASMQFAQSTSHRKAV